MLEVMYHCNLLIFFQGEQESKEQLKETKDETDDHSIRPSFKSLKEAKVSHFLLLFFLLF